MASGDASLVETVMATPDELAAAGLPKDVVDKVAAAAASRGEKVGALLKWLAGWTRQTVWNRFDGTFPHVIPADPTDGPAKDVVVYENAMIFPGMAAGQADAAAAPPRIAFLQIPDMIRLGETWKFIELPRAIDPEKPVVQSVSGIRAMDLRPVEQRPAARRGGGRGAQGPGRLRRQERPAHAGRRPAREGPVLRRPHPLPPRHGQGVEDADEDKLIYDKQVVDSLVAALRTGQYPQGASRWIRSSPPGASWARTRPTASSAPTSP